MTIQVLRGCITLLLVVICLAAGCDVGPISPPPEMEVHDLEDSDTSTQADSDPDTDSDLIPIDTDTDTETDTGTDRDLMRMWKCLICIDD